MNCDVANVESSPWAHAAAPVWTSPLSDVSSCPAAGPAGFDELWADPMAPANLVLRADEQCMRITVHDGADTVFMTAVEN